MKVVRGPQWKWAEQDGGAGALGELVGPAGQCRGGQWWTVRWARGFKNAYRVGCDGKHDLQPADCRLRSEPRPSCAYDQLFWPEGALPVQGAAEGGCSRGGRVPVGSSCQFSKAGMLCDQPRCLEGAEWSTSRPVCHREAAACSYDALSAPSGARPVGGIPGCHGGGLVPNGGHCSFSRAGHYCELAQCEHGRWLKAAPRCSETPAGHPCPFSELVLPKGAGGSGCQGSRSAPSGTTCLPTLPSHTCELSVCLPDGTWSREHPACRREGCEPAQLTVPQGAEVRGRLCAAGQVTPVGAACSVLLNGRSCGEALCESSGWAFTDRCPKAAAPVIRAPSNSSGALAQCALLPEEVRMGSAVRRGPSWSWHQQDGSGAGTVTGFDVRCAGGGWWVQVRWRETGVENNYRVGCSGKTDLCRAQPAPAQHAPSGGRGRGEGRGGAVLRGGGARGGFGSGRGVAVPAVSSALAGDDMDREYDCVDATQLAGKPLAVLETPEGRRHCLRFCANAPLCGGVNFVPANNTCRLLRSAGGASGAVGVQGCRRTVSGGAAEAEVAFQCEPGADYKGANLFHFLAVASSADCQGYCAKVPECVASVFRPGGCTLKGVLAERFLPQDADETTTCSRLATGERAADRAVSVSKGARAGYRCEQDTRLVGETLHTVPSVPDVALCRAVCTRRGECAAFSYAADRTCVLLTIDSYAVPTNGAQACWKEGRGAEAAPPSPAAQVIVSSRRAGQLSAPYNGAFPEKEVSAVREQCVTAGTLWVESGGSWTYQGSPAAVVTEPPLCWDWTCHLDQYYQGEQIMRVINVTLEKCQELCTDLPECCAFTHRAACPGLGAPNGNRAQCFTCDLMRAPAEPPLGSDTVWRATTSCRSSRRCDAGACVQMAFTVDNATCPDQDTFLGQERADWNSLVHEIVDGGLIGPDAIQSLDVASRECCADNCSVGGSPPATCELQYNQFLLPPFVVAPPVLSPACRRTTLYLLANQSAFAALWQFQSDIAAKAAAFNFAGSALAVQLGAVEVILTPAAEFQCLVQPPPATSSPTGPVVNFMRNLTELRLCFNMPLTVCEWKPLQAQFFADFQRYLNETLYPEVDGLTALLNSTNPGSQLANSYGPIADFADNVKMFPLQGKTEDCDGTTYIGRPSPDAEPVNPYIANAAESVGFGHILSPQQLYILPTDGRKGMVLDMDFDQGKGEGSAPRVIEEHLQTVGMAALRSGMRSAAAKAIAAALRRARPRRYQCQSKQTYSGEVLGAPKEALDPDDCLARCTRSAGCAAAVFAADGTCTLHGPAAALADAPSGSSLMACAEQQGPRAHRPAGEFRCERDRAYVGGDIFFMGRVNTSGECEHLCRTISAECDLFVWNGELETCALKTSDEAAEVDDMPEHSGLACRRAPEERSEYRCAEAAYVGGDLFQVEDVSSTRACEGYCSAVGRCAVAQYDAAQRRCALRSADAAPMPSSSGHEMACRKQRGTALSSAQSEEYHCDSDWSYSGGEVARIPAVHPDQCLQLCSQSGRCAIAVWEHGECSLHTATAEQQRRPGAIGCVRWRAEFRDAATAAAAAAAADTYSCEEGVTHMGGDIMQVENAPDAEECKVHCAATPACALFTFSKHVCFLKTSEAVAAEDAGAMSCQREAAAARPTVSGGFKCTSGFGYYGGRLATLSGVDSPAACAHNCGNVPECAAATFMGKVCGLISAAGTRTALPGSTACVREVDAAAVNSSSPPLGPSSGFTCRRQRLLGGLLFDVAGVGSPAECAAHCRKVSAECAAFSLSAAGVCSLRSVYASVIDAENSFSGTTCFASAPASAPAAYRCQEGATLEGRPLRVISASSSAEDCQWACSADPACRGFALAGGVCSLQPAASKPRPAPPGDHALACVRSPMPPPPPEGRRAAWHCSADTAYAGGELGIAAPVTAPEDCQALCAAEQDCAVAVLTPRGSCHLKSRAAAPVPRHAVVAVVRAQRQGLLPLSGVACIRERSEQRPWSEPDAQESFRCLRQRALVGGELLSLAGLSLADCQAQCARVPQCAAAVVGGGLCSLRTASAAQVAAPTTESVVCLRSFDSSAAFDGFECGAGGGAAGGELLQVSGVASPSECAAHCAIAADCVLAVHSTTSKVCSLRGGGAGPAESAEPGSVVCLRAGAEPAAAAAAAPRPAVGWTCSPQPVGGGDLFLLTGVGSVRQCQLQCEQISSCTAFEHRSGAADCLLKTAAAHSQTATAARPPGTVGCQRAESPAPRRDALGRPVEQCRCAANWEAPADGARCAERQHGCPARACDAAAHRWCRVANPGCATEGYGGWTYCDDSTPVHREGGLVSDRRRGEALWGTVAVPPNAAAVLDLVLTKTTVLVGGKLQAMLGFDIDTSGTVTRVFDNTAAAATGFQIGDRFVQVGTVDIAAAAAATRSEAVLQALEAAPDGPVAVRVERWTPPEGLVWYFDFAHLVRLPHVTHDVFSGLAPPHFGGHDVHDTEGGFWVHTRVRAAVGGLLGPTEENWHALNDLVRNELQEIGGRFRESMNPVLSAMGLHPMEAGNVEVAAWSTPMFHRRAPVSKLNMLLVFHDDLCSAHEDGGAAVVAFLAGCLGMSPELLQVWDIERWGMERSHLPACYPSCRGNASLTKLFECDRSLGEPMGCLNAQGQSVEQRRVECREGGNEPDPAELVPVNLAGGAAARRAAPQALGGSTDCRIEMQVTLLLEQDVLATEAQRIQNRNDTWTAAEAALQSALTATAGPCDASALKLLHVETSYVDERFERRPICRTPAPVGGGTLNETGATPIPDEMPPADFIGWEDEGRAVMSAVSGRHLLQFQKKAAARRPVVQGAGDGQPGRALYDPHRRLERIRRAEQEVLQGRGAARRAHTLQAATGYQPGIIQKEGCRPGAQSVQYGLMSNYWNLDNKQPLQQLTLQECNDACLGHEDCEGFSREALNTTADDEPADCYLKRKVLPYCGDQYAWQDWGTYVTRCPPPDTNPCTWTMVENAALHVVEEYKTHLQVESAQDCRDICERLDDCIGVSYKRWTGTCWFVHDKQGSHVDHQEYTSYLCRRLVRTPSPYSGYAGTPAPPGWGDCRDHGGRCNSGEGTMCYSGLGTYRCGCAPGYLCDATQSDCSDPAVTKKCVRREITGHACVGDEHGCTAVAGGACYQLEGSDYACGCVHGYHCVGAACGNTTAALNCVPDSCTDAMIGPENWAVIQTIGGNTGDPVFDQLFAGWWSCADCGSLPLPTAPLTPALTQAWTAAQQAAVADARGNCRSGPTPAPTGSMALAAAWVQAWSETLDDASRRQGQCWDMHGRVHITCKTYQNASWSASGTAPGLPPESLDVSVSYVRVHTDRQHEMSVLLSGVPVDTLLGIGSAGGLSDGLSSSPLEQLREQFAAAARVDLNKVAVRRVCVERAITGEVIACFDAAGRPEGCFTPGVEYTSALSDLATPSAGSAAACQDLCQGTPQCKFFAYDTVTQDCHLLGSSGTSQPNANMVSGPVQCGVSWSADHCAVVRLSHFSDAAGSDTQCDGLYQAAPTVSEWTPVDPVSGNNKDRVLVATSPGGTFACIHKDSVRPTSGDSAVSLCPSGADCQTADWWAANLVCKGNDSATADPLLDRQATICQHPSNGTTDAWGNARSTTGQTADVEHRLQCPIGRVLVIQDAFYGRSHCHGDLCFSDQTAAPGYRNCASDWCNTTGPLALREATPGVLSRVGGRSCRCEADAAVLLPALRAKCGVATQRDCLVKARPGWLSVPEGRPSWWIDSCRDENKYLWVKYSCVPAVSERQAAALQKESALDAASVAALCGAGDCNVRTEVSVDVPETDVMRVVQHSDGSTTTLGTADALPSGSHVAQEIGEGAAGGVTESVDDNVLGELQTSEGLPFVSQLLTALAEQNGQQLAESTGVGSAHFVGVCHIATSGPHIVCLQGHCEAPDEGAMDTIRTACSGAPQCGPSFCNAHGTATGFWGGCSCLCDKGYVGERCDMCDVGRRSYPACVPAAPVATPPLQSPRAPAPTPLLLPSDSELEGLGFPQLVQLAQRAGVWDEDIETKQGVIAALKAQRDSQVPPPPPPSPGAGEPLGGLLQQAFHVVLSVPPKELSQQGGLPEALQRVLAPYGAKAVRLQYVCAASACVPECPSGLVRDWPAEEREACAAQGEGPPPSGSADAEGSPFVGATGSSVVELSVSYAPNGDDPQASLAAQAAMSQVALEGLVGRPEGPASEFGILGAALVAKPGSEPQGSQQQPAGWDLVAAFRDSVVPVATLTAIACVCLFVLFALYGKLPSVASAAPKSVPQFGEWVDGTDVCIIRKEPSEAMGVSWEDHTLVASVIDGSAAARAGLRNFIGRRVTHINGHPVQRLSDIRQLSNGAAELHLRFDEEDIPVCLHVNIGLDHFSEDRFVEELAACIDVPVHRISVVNVAEESATGIAVTLTFAGASPRFVRQLLDQCDAPHGRLAERLGVSAASVASEGGEFGSTRAGAGDLDDDDCDLYVSSQWADEPVAAASGGYRLVQGFSMNGQPTWEKVSGGHWLYSTPSGHWCVTSSPKEFCDGLGVMRTQAPHGGALPEDAGSWETETGVDADIVVSARPVIVQGFRVGQRITSAEDITERSRIIVPIGQPGWVKGAASKIPDCGLKVRFDSLDRDVNVLPEEVDNARGPVVNVLSPGKVWRQCMIVNSNHTHLKVHYIGYDHEYDEWIEQGSDRVERVAVSLPEGGAVRLSPLAARRGVLADGAVGVIVRDAGPQHRSPYKVRGPQGDFSWYSGDDLVVAEDPAGRAASSGAGEASDPESPASGS